MHSLLLRFMGFSAVLSFYANIAMGDPATTEPLTADSLASWVIRANPGLEAIQASAEAAAYRLDSAGSLDDPMLSYGFAPLTANANRGINQKISFSQKIPWPGTLAARENTARYEAIVADRNVDALRLKVIARAKSAFAEWQFVHSALDIHHATRALINELIATAETRYSAGNGLKQDILQAEVERTELDNQLLQLVRLKTSLQARINALLNRTPGAALPAAGSIPQQIATPSLEELQQLALAQNPELSRLDAQVSARESRITLAEKAFYPDFQVGVGYNALWDDADKRPIFGVSINVPLDRGKRRSELGRARAEKRSAEWSLVERRATLLADLAQARAEVIEAQSSLALYKNQLIPLAAEYLEAAVTDYRSGKGSFLNVIMAEQGKLGTDLSLARTHADYTRRLAELEHWVGGSVNGPRTVPGAQQ